MTNFILFDPLYSDVVIDIHFPHGNFLDYTYHNVRLKSSMLRYFLIYFNETSKSVTMSIIKSERICNLNIRCRILKIIQSVLQTLAFILGSNSVNSIRVTFIFIFLVLRVKNTIVITRIFSILIKT